MLIENSYSSSSFDKIYCIANVIFLITMGSSSTILNVLALKFFMKETSIFNLVFKWTTLTDLATLGASFPVMVSYASYRSPVIFANLSFCAVWHVTWRVITRFSVHLVGIMSVTRTIAICFPLLRPINITIIRAVIAVDILSVSAATIWSFSLDRTIEYFKIPVICVASNKISVSRNRILDVFLVFVPVLVMTVGYTISLSKLRQTNRDGQNNRVLNRRRIQSGVTILIVTAMCITINLPYIVGSLIVFVKMQRWHQANDDISLPPYYLHYMVVTSYVVNSVANPFIYVWRLRDFRVYIVNLKDQSLVKLRIIRTAVEVQIRTRSSRRTRSNITESQQLSNIAVSPPLTPPTEEYQTIPQTALYRQTALSRQAALSRQTDQSTEPAQRTNISFQTFQIDQPVSSNRNQTTEKTKPTVTSDQTNCYIFENQSTRILTLDTIPEER